MIGGAHRRRVRDPRTGHRLQRARVDRPAVQALEHPDQVLQRPERERSPRCREAGVIPVRHALLHPVAEIRQRVRGATRANLEIRIDARSAHASRTITRGEFVRRRTIPIRCG